MKSKPLFDNLKTKLFRVFLIIYATIYAIILLLGIYSAFKISNLTYTILLFIVIFILTVIPIIYLYYLEKVLDPINHINEYIKNLSTFRYYKKKEYTNIKPLGED